MHVCAFYLRSHKSVKAGVSSSVPTDVGPGRWEGREEDCRGVGWVRGRKGRTGKGLSSPA